MKRKQIGSSLILIAVLLQAFLLGTSLAQTAVSTQYIMGGMYPGGYNYTIWKESSTFYAKDSYGQLVFSSTNASYVINSCVQAYDPASENDAGNRIALMYGSYSIDAPILLNVWHTSLEGLGHAPTLTAAASLNDDVIKVSNYSITIKGIGINGNKGSQTQGNGINITSSATTNRAYILECTIASCKDNGIYVGNVGGATFEQIIIQNTAIWSCDESGIYLGGSCYDFKIISCTIGNNGALGIDAVGCAEGQIVGNAVFDNDNDNILMYNSWGITITGNHITNSDEDGIQVEGSHWITISSNTINDNDLDNVGSVGIRLQTSHNCTVTGNTATNSAGQSQDLGIYELVSCGDDIFVANVCSGTVAGMWIYGSGSIAEHNLNQTQT